MTDHTRIERSALALFANGKGEWLRWLLSLAAAAFIAWSTVSARISVIEEREQNHYEELLRQFNMLRDDIRALGKSRD